MADPILHSLSLCAGVGMLDEGVRTALDYLGIASRTVAYAEWEAPAASQLVALMEAGAVEPAPVWCGDFRRMPAERFRGTVDLVTSGFPCTDLSIAGRRAGLDGKRSGLFFDVVDVAERCGAWCLALENVSAIATATASVVDEAEGELEERAAARVVGELADRGWDAEWITLSASDVGASHGRARWFCFAWRRGVADPARHGRDRQHGEAGSRRGVCEAGNPLAHAERAERGPECSCGVGSIEGHDERGRQADGGAGVAVEILGNTECPRRTQAGRGSVQHAGGEPEPGCCAVADPQRESRGSEHEHESRQRTTPREEHGSVLGVGCADYDGIGMADTSQPRLPDTEQRIAGSAGGGA